MKPANLLECYIWLKFWSQDVSWKRWVKVVLMTMFMQLLKAHDQQVRGEHNVLNISMHLEIYSLFNLLVTVPHVEQVFKMLCVAIIFFTQRNKHWNKAIRVLHDSDCLLPGLSRCKSTLLRSIANFTLIINCHNNQSLCSKSTFLQIEID